MLGLSDSLLHDLFPIIFSDNNDNGGMRIVLLYYKKAGLQEGGHSVQRCFENGGIIIWVRPEERGSPSMQQVRV